MSHNMHTRADQCLKPPDPLPPPQLKHASNVIYEHSHLKPLKSGETMARPHSAT